MRVSAARPPAVLEAAYYVQVCYAVMGPAIGLTFGSAGILMLCLVAAASMLSVGRYAIPIARFALLPVACGLSFFVIQVFVHRSDLDDSYVRDWIPWLIGMVGLQFIAMRPGFLHRAALVVFLLGVCTLPYLKSFGPEHRTGLEKTITIANPNDLGAWFGFCCVYFAVLGLEARRPWLRVAAWPLAMCSLLFLGMSVSRAPLFATACCVVFALRRVLKKGFLPLLFLALAAWIAFALGLFDRPAAQYAQRGLEETGRLLVWPLAIARFLDAPLAGVGTDHVATYLPQADVSVTPHNALIFIALSSGIVPLALFLVYCAQLVRNAYRSSPALEPDAPFHRALLLYALLIAMNLNAAFMLPWVMVTFASISAAGLFARARASAVESRSRIHARALSTPRTPAEAGVVCRG